MKRFLILTLTFCLLIPLTACGQGGTPAQTAAVSGTDTAAATTAAPETELTDGLPDTDMKGFAFRILHHDPEHIGWVKHVLDAEALTGSVIDDAMYERNSYIEDRFRCKLEYQEVADTVSTLKTAVPAGTDDFEMAMVYNVNLIGAIDYLADLDHLEAIRQDAEYWNPIASETFRVGDKQLALAGNFTLSHISGTTSVIFNKKLYSAVGEKTSLYDVVREGKWTFDRFYQLCQKAETDLNGDGKYDTNDRFGATGQSPKAFYHTLTMGADLTYMGWDKEHYPTFVLGSDEKLVGFVQKVINSVISDGNAIYFNAGMGANSEMDRKLFAEGHFLFMQIVFQYMEDFREMEDDFGILPAPKYDEAQERYLSYCTPGELTTLPRSCPADRYANVGMLLEAMAFHGHHNIVPLYKEVTLQYQMSRDADSGEMIDIIFSGVAFDFGVIGWQNTCGNKIIEGLYIPKSTDVASLAASLQSTLTADADKLKTAAALVP